MNRPEPDDLSHLSMLDLFRAEAESQTNILNHGLVELESAPGSTAQLESLMRAAHSLKGAARIVDLPGAVRIAHAMEDVLVAAQHGQLKLQRRQIDLLLAGVDLLQDIARCPETELSRWEADHDKQIEAYLGGIIQLDAQERQADKIISEPHQYEGAQEITPPEKPADARRSQSGAMEVQPAPAMQSNFGTQPDRQASSALISPAKESERVLRLTVESLNRMLGLAGESMVESRWLHPFADSLRRLKRLQENMAETLENLSGSMESQDTVGCHFSGHSTTLLEEMKSRAADCRLSLADRISELESFELRFAQIAHRLYLEALHCRMRPFSDGLQRFPRMVRDLARALGKQVRLEILGGNTPVDRDILDQLDSPLAHLLRNAVDHGCELPSVRVRAGKPPVATIRLEARHSAGALRVTLSDDGAGVNTEHIREAVMRRRLISADVAGRLSETELLEFLFLPGFSLREEVTDLSGRGVGLDAVRSAVKAMRGHVAVRQQRTATATRVGMRFEIQLPLTLSVIRALLVEIGGEPYAVPLGQIVRSLKLPGDRIEMMEGRPYYTLGDRHIGLVWADAVLGVVAKARPRPEGWVGAIPGEQGRGAGISSGTLDLRHDTLSVVVLGEHSSQYGLVVDRFLGERELVVHPLDPRLGKVRDISAAALMEDGAPALILDVDDLVRSVEAFVQGRVFEELEDRSGEKPRDPGQGLPGSSRHETLRQRRPTSTRQQLRVLVVDDSPAAREQMRNLIAGRGYRADVAVNGLDAWNAVRSNDYDLVIADVDMPRIDGFELAALLKQDSRFKSLPVMFVTYKVAEADRLRGLESGAVGYFTKGTFHDGELLKAVAVLLGEPKTL